MTDRHARDVIDNHPYPSTHPVQRLRHVVSVFAEVTAETVAVQATSGIYPADATVGGRDRGITGLTHGDLRALLARLDG